MSTFEDPTEEVRMVMTAVINALAGEREKLEQQYGQVWDSDELSRDFDVLAFLAPYVAVRRRSDGKAGTLLFQHSPRYYWGFEEDDGR